MRIPPAYESSAWLMAATAAGLAWGKGTLLRGHGLIALTLPAALQAIVLLVAGGALARNTDTPHHRAIVRWCLGLLAYTTLLLVSDPFLWEGGITAERGVTALLLLAPSLLGLCVLSRGRSRLAAAGAALLFVASVAIVVHNVGHGGRGGCGFLGWWTA